MAAIGLVLFCDVDGPDDTLVPQISHEELQTNEGKDTEAENGEDHHIWQLLHRLDQSANNGLQTFEISNMHTHTRTNMHTRTQTHTQKKAQTVAYVFESQKCLKGVSRYDVMWGLVSVLYTYYVDLWFSTDGILTYLDCWEQCNFLSG